MFIICTHDPILRSAAPTLANKWGTLTSLGGNQEQHAAGVQLGQALGGLQTDEPLCLAAHQTDGKFGDAKGPWLWTAGDLAAIIQGGLPGGYNGPILIHAVTPGPDATAATFPQSLAAALGAAKAFCGGTVYGFNTAVTDITGYPDPQTLSSNPNLTANTVTC